MLYSNDKKCIKSKKTSSFRLPLLSRIIAFFVLISFSTSIFANGFDNSLPDGVDTNTLEMYLDRADLAVDREEWYRLATYGAEIVVASWENEYLLSLENPDNTGAAITPVELMNSIDDIMEKRYTEWIVENFFNDSISGDSKSLFDSIKETNMEYLYVIDEETGELKKDEAGDLVLQKSDNLEEDNASWITAVTQAIDASIDSFIDMSTQWYSEIALLLNPEETPWLDDEYDRHFSDYEESYREELDFIFLYEQRRFYNYRTLDQYSLEKKSEKEGAESIANGLIESAQEDLLGGLQKLKDGLDAIDESDPTGASTIEAENWREEFRIVFEEGMRKWETAEEELLFERVQWDQRVEEDVKTGEQIWVDAYEKLSKSRIQWQNDLNDLIDEGLAKWSEIDEALITSITKAKTELNENIEKRKQSLSTQVNSLVDIYVKSTSVIRTARDSIKYWIEEHYIETYHDESYWIENEEFWADTSKFRAEYQISPDDRSRTVENILYWKNALSTYKNYKTTAEEKLIGTYGIILKDSINSIPGLDWNSFENGAADDLLGNLDLTTWESEEASIGEDWENRYLDKYQVELVKARALKDYWDKQLEIARAVYDYSNDISSERDQDVVTQQKYTDAKDAFDLARDGYNGALQALTAEAETLADVQETMTEKMDLMKESQLALEQAQKDYQDAFLIFTAGNDVYFSEKITRYYKLLAEKAGFAENQPENSYADYLMAYHDAASKYDESLFYQNLNTQVFHLINGFSIADSSVKIEGLQDLYEKKEAAELWDFNAADWALELEKLDISPDSNPSLYNQLMNEFNWRTSISNENKDIDLFFSEIRINSWVEIGKRLKIDPYERTYEEISLLTSPSMDKWFEDINFDSISSDYESEISGMNKIDQIQYLGDTSQGRFLFERAELELAVFSKIKSLDVTSENWSTDLIENIETDSRVDQVAKAIILDRLFYGSKGKTDIEKEEMKSLFYEQIDEWIEPLNNLVSFFKSGSDINTEKFNIDNYRDEYRELVGTSDIIKQFIAGISYLSLSAPQDWISDDEILGATERQYSYSNLASYLTEDLILKKNSFASWNSILTKNLNRTAALRNEQKSNALVKTGEVLSNYNIAQLDNSAFVFIPPEETWETWESSGLTIDRWFTDLQLSLQESYEGLPSFVISETGNYISSLVSYFVLKASLDGIDIGNTYALNDETMENDLINAQNEKIRQIYNLRLIINEDRAQSNGVSSINLSNLFKINSLIGDVSDSLPGVETADIKNEVLELASAFVVKEINKDAGFIDYSSVTSEDLLSILNEIISEYDEDVLIGIDESFKNEIVENSQSIIRIASMLESDYLNDIAEITDPEVKQAALYKIWSEIFISANDEGDSSEITVLSAFEASEEVVDSISMSFFKVYCDLYENWTDTGLSEEDQIAYLLEETSNNNSTLLNFMERAEFITFQMESDPKLTLFSTPWQDSYPSDGDLILFHFSHELKNRIDKEALGITIDEIDLDSINAMIDSLIIPDTIKAELALFRDSYINDLGLTAGIDPITSEHIDSQADSLKSRFSDILGMNDFKNLLASTGMEENLSADFLFSNISKLAGLEQVEAGISTYNYALTLLDGIISIPLLNLGKTIDSGSTIEEIDSIYDIYLYSLPVDLSAITDEDELLYAMQLSYVHYLKDETVELNTAVIIDSFVKTLDENADYLKFSNYSGILASISDLPIIDLKAFLMDKLSSQWSGEDEILTLIKETNDETQFLSNYMYGYAIEKFAGEYEINTPEATVLADNFMELLGISASDSVLNGDFAQKFQDSEGFDKILLAASNDSNEALAYSLKLGEMMDPEKEISPLLESLSEDLKKPTELFIDKINSISNYSSAIENSSFEYIIDTIENSSFKNIVENTMFLEGIGIDDFIYTINSQTSSESYVDKILQFRKGKVSLANIHLDTILIQSMNNAIEEAGEMNFLSNVQTMNSNFLTRIDEDRYNYRAYLGPEYIDLVPADNLDPNEHNDDLIPQSIDNGAMDFYRDNISGVLDFYNNELIEVLSVIDIRKNGLQSVITLMNKGIVSEKIATDPDQFFFNTYENPLLFESSLKPEDEGFNAIESEYKKAVSQLSDYNKEVYFFRTEIERNGKNLAEFRKKSDSEKNAKLAVKQKAVDDAVNVYDTAKNEWADSITAVKSQQIAYEALFNEVSTAEIEYTAKQFELDKAEAIKEYADNVYIDDDIETEDSLEVETVDPSDRLLYAAKKQKFSDAAYRALNDLLSDEADIKDFTLEDEEYRTAYEGYKRHFKNLIEIEKINGLLGSTIAEQKETIEKLERQYDNNINSNILNASNPVDPRKRDLEDDQYQWQDFLTVNFTPSGSDYLNYSLQGSSLGAVTEEGGELYINRTSGDYFNKYFYFGGSIQELTDPSGLYSFNLEQAQSLYDAYVAINGEENIRSYDEDKKQWALDMNSYLSSGKDSNQVLDDWAMAHWYEMSLKRDANTVDNVLTKEQELLNNFWNGAALTAEQIADKTAEMVGQEYSGYIDDLTNRAKAAYNRVQGNAEERKLYKFYSLSHAMNNTVDKVGSIENGSKSGDFFMDDTVKYTLLKDMIPSKIKARKAPHLIVGTVLASAAAAAYISAAAVAGIFIIGPILAAVFLVVAISCTALSIDEFTRANDLQHIIDEVNLRASDEGISKSNIDGSKTFLKVALKEQQRLKDEIEFEKQKLRKLEGRENPGDAITNDKMFSGILLSAEMNDISIGSFLGLSDKEKAGRTDDKILKDLFGAYDEQIGEDAVIRNEDIGSLLLGFREAGESEVSSKENELNSRISVLNSLQYEKQTDQMLASDDYREYVNNYNSFTIDGNGKVKLIETVSEIDEEGNEVFIRVDNETDEEIKRNLFYNTTEISFEKSSFVTRSHERRLLETKMNILVSLQISSPELLSDLSLKNITDFELGVLGSAKNDLNQMYANRLDNLREIKFDQWDHMYSDFQFKQKKWSDSIVAVQMRGAQEWKRALKRFDRERTSWIDNVQDEYELKSEEWNLQYASFLQGKADWVNETAQAAITAGSSLSLSGISSSADEHINNLTSGIITDLAIETPDADAIVTRLTGGKLAQLLNNARGLNMSSDSVRTETHGMLSLDPMAKINLMDVVKDFQSENKDELKKKVYLITAMKAFNSIKEAYENMKTMVFDSNHGINASLDDTFGDAGYKESNNVYTKKIITDATLFNTEFDNVQFDGYIDYVISNDIQAIMNLSLEQSDLDGLNAEGIDARLSRVLKQYENVREDIFGTASGEEIKMFTANEDSREDDPSTWDKITGWISGAISDISNFITGDDEDDDSYVDTDTTRNMSVKDGQFNGHVGYAPVLFDDANFENAVKKEDMAKNVRYDGAGEMGRIMLEYMRFNLLEGRGWNELSKPASERRMWDDDDFKPLGFEAPTLQTINSIATSIIANTMGGAFGWLISCIDDFQTGVRDVAWNRKDWDDALLDLGKTVAISYAADWAAGAVGDYMGTALEGVNPIIQDTLTTGAQMFTSNAVTGGINSFSWENGFDMEQFGESLFGADAMLGYFAGMAGAAATSGMNQFINTTNTGLKLTEVFNTKGLNAISNLSGSLVNAGVTLGISGNTSINLLNMSMFGLTKGSEDNKSPYSKGLLELHFGKDGAGMNIGSGGVNMSMDMIYNSIKGIGEASDVVKMKYGSDEDKILLEEANLKGITGDKEQIAMGRKLFERLIELDWVPEADFDGDYNSNNPNTIYVNEKYKSMDLETLIQLASVLSHENVHLTDLENGGETTEADAYRKGIEEYVKILDTLGLEGDVSFLVSMVAKMADPENYDINTGDDNYAEISITKDTIGIRSSTFSERLMNPDFVGSTLRGLASLLGLNPYTDEKQPESDLDPRANERAHQIESDQIAALLFFAGAALSAEQIAANGGGSLLSYLGSLFNLNPQNIESLGDLAGTASNYSDIFNSITEYLSQGDIQINGAEGYDEFIRQVLKAEGFRDVEGYNISQDNDILNIMEQAGVPSEVANVFGGDKDLENQAANEVFNNFIFVSSLYQMGVTDPQTISDLYLLGVPFSRTTDEGLVLWNNSPGFAEANKGLTSTYFEKDQYIDYQDKLDKMSTFNFMRSQYNSGNINLDTDFMLDMDAKYKKMMDDGDNFEFNDYFWNQYNLYTYNLFN